MSDLMILFHAEDKTRRWRVEVENATARLELAKIHENCAYLISQHEPVASLGLDREKLRHVLNFIHHGDLERLLREVGGKHESLPR